MKKIALIYMGGTFGCIGQPLSPMPESEFLPILEKIFARNVVIDCFAAASVKDSSAFTAQDWFLLIRQIQDLQLLHYQDFIIIHGTDTLSYAAATLARFLQQSSRVIVTGSQYPLLNVSGQDIRDFTDALDNLNTAIEHIQKVPMGVYIAFHHKIFHASTVLKIHSTALDAFQGIPFTQEIQSESKSVEQFIVQVEHLAHVNALNIINLTLQPIELPQLSKTLSILKQQLPTALILQAYGTGNMATNREIINDCIEIQQLGCPIILDTQVAFGGLDQRYAVSEWLTEAKILINDTHSHADLYAKILKMYLQYPSTNQWHEHWYD